MLFNVHASDSAQGLLFLYCFIFFCLLCLESVLWISVFKICFVVLSTF